MVKYLHDSRGKKEWYIRLLYTTIVLFDQVKVPVIDNVSADKRINFIPVHNVLCERLIQRQRNKKITLQIIYDDTRPEWPGR